MMTPDSHHQVSIGPKASSPRRRLVALLGLVFFGYLSIAAILNAPLIRHITTHTYTYAPDGDDQYFVWLINWVKTSVVNHQHPLWKTDVVYYPNGVDLRLGADGYFNTALATAIDAVTNNPILAYNLVMLGSLVFSAWAAFVLAFVLWRHWFAAFLSGLVFGFTSFLISRSQGHINLVAAESIPFVALCLIQLSRTGRWRWAAGLVLSTAWAGLSSNYYLLSTLIMSGCVVIWTLLTRPKKLWLDPIGKICGAVGLGILLYIAAIWPVFSAIQHAPVFIIPEIYSFVYSLDITSFFLPPGWQYFGGPQLAPITSKIFISNESIAFLGWLELGVLVVGGIFWKRIRRTSANNQILMLWLLLAGVSVLFALGPYLRVFGLYTGIPLVFHFLRGFPLVGMLSSPARFVIVALLSASMFFGYYIQEFYSTHRGKNIALFWVGLLLTLGLIGERWISPYGLRDYRVPDSSTYLRGAPDTGAVLDIPLSIDVYPEYTLSQYQHGRPIVSGYMSRYTGTTERNAFILSTPELVRYVCGNDAAAAPVQRTISQLADWLQTKGVAYIVVHYDRECRGVNLSEFTQYIHGFQPVFTDSTTSIYRVADLVTPLPR